MTETELPAEAATKQLFEQYGNEVRKYARYMLGNWSEADDAVQEIFLRVFIGWSKYSGRSQARTWLWAITRNYIRDVLRSDKKSRRHASVPFENQHLATYITLEEMEIAEALSKLREPQRQVIILRYLEGMSVEDTAVILGWSQSKVRTTAHRALHHLRALLSEEKQRLPRMEGENSGF
jgi:RNA polymerase sigma-70 factor (ECF subfamily)